jgi:hypothetical protein
MRTDFDFSAFRPASKPGSWKNASLEKEYPKSKWVDVDLV